MTPNFIIGDGGIAVIDSGTCRAGAERIHAAIRKVSGKPVRWMVNTGGQNHRWLGNIHFHEQGATVTASAAASADMHERAAEQMIQAEQLIEKGFTGTAPAYIDDGAFDPVEASQGLDQSRFSYLGKLRRFALSQHQCPERGRGAFQGSVTVCLKEITYNMKQMGTDNTTDR